MISFANQLLLEKEFDQKKGNSFNKKDDSFAVHFY